MGSARSPRSAGLREVPVNREFRLRIETHALSEVSRECVIRKSPIKALVIDTDESQKYVSGHENIVCPILGDLFS